MSETNAAVVATPTEALSGTPTPTPATDGAAAAPPPAITSREYFQGIHKRAETPAPVEPTAEPVAPSDATAIESSSAEPAPVVDATGRAHDPATGKFLPGGTNEPASAGSADTPAAPAPEGLVRIELPEGHPLRERGRTHYEVRVSSPEEEAEIRGLMATPIKQRELKEARERIAEMEERLLRVQASEAARAKWEQGLDPDTRAMLQAVEAVNPDAAALMRRGLEATLPDLTEQEFRTLADERIAQEVQQEAAGFLRRTQQVAEVVYADIAREPYFPELYHKARMAYGAELQAREARGEPHGASEQEFLQYFRPFIAAHPQASAHYKAKLAEQQRAERERVEVEARQKAEAEAKQKEAEHLAALNDKRKTNPLGTLPMGVATGRATPTGSKPSSKEFMQSVLR